MKKEAISKTGQAVKRPSFYLQEYQAEERRDLDQARQADIQDEIELLRVTMRRTLALAREVQDLSEMLDVLKELANATGKLTGLIRAQQKAGGSEGDLALLLRRAISETWAEAAQDPEVEEGQ